MAKLRKKRKAPKWGNRGGAAKPGYGAGSGRRGKRKKPSARRGSGGGGY